MQYIIRTDQPFDGHCQSVLNKDGTVAYTDGLTLAQYVAENGFPMRIIGEDEMDNLVNTHYETMKSKPTQITRSRFWEMLEVLPPCRWHNAGGFEVFHVSEHLTGPLVSWFAHKGERYWEFTDDCHLSDDTLVALLQG